MSTMNIRDIGILSVAVGSIWAWLACILSFIAAIFFTIAFSTLGWGYVYFKSGNYSHEEQWGLWLVCSNIDNKGSCAVTAKSSFAWYTTAQVTGCMALVVCYITFTVAVLYLVWIRLRKDRRVSMALLTLSLISGILLLVCGTTFGAGWSNYFHNIYPGSFLKYRLSYSFALTIVASVLCLISACLTVWELMTAKHMIPA